MEGSEGSGNEAEEQNPLKKIKPTDSAGQKALTFPETAEKDSENSHNDGEEDTLLRKVKPMTKRIFLIHYIDHLKRTYRWVMKSSLCLLFLIQATSRKC